MRVVTFQFVRNFTRNFSFNYSFPPAQHKKAFETVFWTFNFDREGETPNFYSMMYLVRKKVKCNFKE